MDSKYRDKPLVLCTYCEVCRRKFDTRAQFEYGCHRCAPVDARRHVAKPPPQDWFAQE